MADRLGDYVLDALDETIQRVRANPQGGKIAFVQVHDGILEKLITAYREAALDIPPSGDGPKALDAAARSKPRWVKVGNALVLECEACDNLGVVSGPVGGDVLCPVCRDGALAARSSSTEAVEQERPTGHFTIEHDGFAGTVIGHYTTLEGKQGVVLQQDGTRVVHVYGEKWLKPSPVPAACKPEGEASLPGKEEGRG